jgi:Zn-dependent protease with chaperone function
MDFFAQQATARQRSARLLTVFAAALVLFIAFIGTLPALLQSAWEFCSGHGWQWLWDWRVFAIFAGGVFLVLLAGAAIEWINLADGGAALAARLGAEPLSSSGRDEAAQRLRNIVDEMAIASGRAAPRVFILRHERAINALTAGRRADDAVLILTRGCLDRLTRDEIQGVVAHEFSHLLHGDTALDARLVALLSGLLSIPEIGVDLLRSGWAEGTDPRTHEPATSPTPLLFLAPLGLLLVAVGFAGFLLARALQAAAARQREFLADASAIQFTRNPAGLAGVLNKIAAAPAERLAGPAASSKLGHLHFAPVRRSVLLDWFSAHPPLAARLAAIDRPLATPPAPADTPRSTRQPLARNLADLAAVRAEIGSFVGTAVTPSSEHLSYSQRLIASLPPAVLAAARDPAGAPAIVLGLLLSQDDARHTAELDLVRRTAGTAIADQLVPLAADISILHRAKRLPLLGLALPTLQSLPASAKSSLLASARALAEHDGEVHLFEFALLKALARHLAPRNVATFQGLHQALVRPTVAQFGRPIAILLSACARASTDSHEQAFRAFEAGTAYFSGIMHTLELAPAAGCGLDAVSAALDTFVAVPESYRRVLLAACARAVGFDRQVSQDEAELVRAIADALDCPLPPLLGAAQ